VTRVSLGFFLLPQCQCHYSGYALVETPMSAINCAQLCWLWFHFDASGAPLIAACHSRIFAARRSLRQFFEPLSSELSQIQHSHSTG
jgi:hypothetical protein